MSKEMRRAVAWFFVGVLGCVVAYLWIDRPVAFWVFDNQLNQIYLLKQTRFIPVVLVIIAIMAWFLLILRFCQKKFGLPEKNALLFVNAIALAYFFKSALKVLFGRYGPMTLLKYKPSAHAFPYGFNWFHAGSLYGAFPSGHAAVMAAGMMALSLSYPKCRWFFFLLWLIVAVGLVGMNYHFVGDVIGGGVLGVILAYFTYFTLHSSRVKVRHRERSGL